MRDSLINDWLERVERQQYGQRAHAERVSIYGMALGQRLGLSSESLQQLRLGLLLHDIGKLGVLDAIIRHPGKLSAHERNQVMEHPTIGDTFLADEIGTELLRAVVRCHHERWDGDGYPRGLKGYTIPLFGRIAAICDAWDCMLSDRAYSPAVTVGEAVAELRRCSGTQFDPDLVDTFLSMAHRLVDIPCFVEHLI